MAPSHDPLRPRAGDRPSFDALEGRTARLAAPCVLELLAGKATS